MLKAVIYARYSDASQKEESIEGQLRDCRAYAEREDIMIVGTYIDRAFSARTDDRPEFQRMVHDSDKKLFDMVLVWKLDRFARNRYDSAHYKAILKKNGVKLVSAMETISKGPEGILMESVLEGYAEYYSAELSVKIHRGQRENALKGKNNGGGIPLGYLLGPDQKLVIDPETAPLVVEAFQRYAEGETVRSIVEDFNSRQLHTKRGKPFTVSSLGAIWTNKKYIGQYRYQDVVIENGVPAIVPEELFYRVQERIEKNKRAPARAKAKEEYLLTGKLFCGDCGKMMVGESGRGRNGVHYYYKCGAAKRNKGCKKKAVKKGWIEKVVVYYTVNRVLQDEEIDKISDRLVALQGQENTLLPCLRQQLAETEKALDNLVNAITQGLLTPSTKKKLVELEDRKESLQISILKEELQKPKFTKEYITRYIKRFRYGNPDSKSYQRQIIDIFVNSVYVLEDKIVFTYNFRDGTETISLAEIASALGSDLNGFRPPRRSKVRFAPTLFYAYA